MPRGNTSKVWTSEILNTLIEHVDSNKGINSIYVTNKLEACEQAARHINSLHPQSQISPKQVENKLQKINVTKNRVSSSASAGRFYQQGKIALSQEFLRQFPGQQPTTLSNAVNNEEDVHTAGALDNSASGASQRDSEDRAGLSEPAGLQENHRKRRRDNEEAHSEQSDIQPPQAKKPRRKGKESADTRADGEDHLSSEEVHLLSDRPAGILTREENEIIWGFRGHFPDFGLDQPSFVDLQRWTKDLKFAITHAAVGMWQREHPEQDTQLNAWERADLESMPKVAASLKNPRFLELCTMMFQGSDMTENYERIITNDLNLRTFTVALLAVAIHLWVLGEGRVNFTGILLEQNERSRAFENLLFDVSPALHRRCRIKANQQALEKVDIKAEAAALAQEFNDVMLVFLKDNGMTQRDAKGREWMQNLRRSFEAGIKLKLKMLLRTKTAEAYTPHMDQQYHPSSMECRNGSGEYEDRVMISVMPGIREALDKPDEYDGSMEAYLVRAEVWVKPTAAARSSAE